MTRPDPKAGQGNDRRRRRCRRMRKYPPRIANSISPAFDGFAPVGGTLPMDLEPASFLAGAAREGVEMSGEPALMSLVSVAKAIAGKKLSSREVTQSCLDRIAQWQPRAQRLHVDRGGHRRSPPRTPPMRRLPRARFPARYTACRWRTRTCDSDAGNVVTCGSKIRREFVPTTTSTALQRLKDAGTVQARLAADGGIRLWPDRPQSALRRGA